MNNTQGIINLVLKAVAVGMAVAVFVLGSVLNAVEANTQIMLLAIGLFTLSVAALQKG